MHQHSSRMASLAGGLIIIALLGACAAPAPGTAVAQTGGVVQAPVGPQNGQIVRIESVAPGGQGVGTTGVGAVTGAVVGGVLGNQIGGGRGRNLATVAGVAGGALAGNAIENNRRANPQAVQGVFRITVQLDQGGQRQIDVPDLGDLGQGDRVRIENNQISRL